MSDEVALVSIMLANNEIGIIQPMKEISNICKKNNVWLHTDAAQAVGNIDVKVNDLGIDLMSISIILTPLSPLAFGTGMFIAIGLLYTIFDTFYSLF